MRLSSNGVLKHVSRGREYPERPVIGVGGVVIENGRALLVRRGRPPLKGEWSIPGGMLELGETLAEAVQRELEEETGLQVRVGDLMELFERIESAGARTRYHFVVADYLCERTAGVARAGGDVTEVAWVREEELTRYSLTDGAKRVLQKAFQVAQQRASSGAPSG